MKASFETEMSPLGPTILDVEVLGNVNDLCLVLSLSDKSRDGKTLSNVNISMNGREARQLVGVLQAMIG